MRDQQSRLSGKELKLACVQDNSVVSTGGEEFPDVPKSLFNGVVVGAHIVYNKARNVLKDLLYPAVEGVTG